jgi:uncharacterized protein (DUF58 family)
MAGAALGALRFEAGAPRRITLGRRRIYILPTRVGVLFALMLVVMLLGSINYNNSLGFVLTFLLGSLALVGILHTYRNLAGLVINGGQAKHVFAGEPAVFRLSLDNRGSYPRYAVHIVRRGQRGGHSAAVDLPGDALCSAEVSLGNTRRGRLPLGEITISSTFPLGLFRAWSNCTPGLGCLVYPRPAGAAGLPPLAPDSADTGPGVQHGSDDFIGFRNYQLGDSPRYIAWKAVAREQGILVKKFAGAGRAVLWLSWQEIPSLAAEARLSQLCRWVIEAERRALRYGLILPELTVPVGTGEAHRQQCLTALALHGRP